MALRKRSDAHSREIEQLKKQEEKKNEFFLAASHQLKSPLAIIQWCLQIALESPTLRGKDKEMVLKALAQAQGMNQLVGDMLHVVRLVGRSGKNQTYTAVDVNLILDEVLNQYELVAHRRKIHLLKGPQERLPLVFVDQAYFRQAIINLVDNAIKYSAEGGTVTAVASEKKGWVEISVSDQGIGMAEADQQRLFTEFFRGDEAKQVAHEGTGLGLVLVKHIIEEFGGEVHVKSELHKGSSFTLRLPLAK